MHFSGRVTGINLQPSVRCAYAAEAYQSPVRQKTSGQTKNSMPIPASLRISDTQVI